MSNTRLRLISLGNARSVARSIKRAQSARSTRKRHNEGEAERRQSAATEPWGSRGMTKPERRENRRWTGNPTEIRPPSRAGSECVVTRVSLRYAAPWATIHAPSGAE